MKFKKTIHYDAYSIGDRLMEGVLFDVDITLDEDGTTTAGPARPHDDNVTSWCERLGGAGGVKHWCDQVDDVFTNSDDRLEELGEAMSDDEWDKYEEIFIRVNKV
jgi:hypothetical protein